MKAISAFAALAALISGSAFAADLPTHKEAPSPAPVAVPAFSWTGFYAGVNAGYAFSQSGDTQTTGTPAFLGFAPTFTPNSLPTNNGGFIGGGQIGYNYQMGSIVAGVETDLDFVGQRNSASFTGAVTPLGTSLTTSATRDLNYLGTLRGRIGFTPFDRMMLFATGGLAYGGVNTSGSVVANAAPALAWSGSNNQTRAGWTVGGGAEYAITNNITLKGEYLFYDLGETSVTALGNAAVQATAALNGVYYTSQARTEGSILRAGLNFKF